MTPTLVVLAAGQGTRFGGDKQTAPLGPGGATIMEYSIYDALRAGFGRIVIVVREEMRAQLYASLTDRLRGRAIVECAVQALDALPAGFALPAGRARPWGTAHAVLAAAQSVGGPFAVANADDLYGRESFLTLGSFLAREAVAELGDGAPPTYALAAFPLRDTLSDTGPVNRAVCETDAAGALVGITERTGLTIADGRGADGGASVSMNLWGFTPAIFPQLEESFREFLRAPGPDRNAEFLLPAAVQSLISARRAVVRVVPAGGSWCGVTYASDAPRVTRYLESAVARGEYPADLWA